MQTELRIGDVARLTGSSARSLRYYESQGLIRSSRTPGGHRIYDDDVVERVTYLKHLYGAGLSSNAIREIIPCLDTPSVLSSGSALHRLVQERDALLVRAVELQKTVAALDALIEYNRSARANVTDDEAIPHRRGQA